MSSHFQLPRTLVLLLAGGEGNRLKQLTHKRAKPVLPFLGQYRLIDFALSNCVHSGLDDVWVIEQFQAPSLNAHLSNGRPWDLDETRGGLQILPPTQGNDEHGWHQGNADALWRNSEAIRAFAPQLIIVLSADGIYRFDYRAAIQFHLEKNAEATFVTTEIEGKEASRFGNVQTTRAGRVTKFAYKPEDPFQKNGKTQVTAEIFVYNATVLLEVLEDLARQTGKSRQNAALADFGNELLPAFVARGKSWALPLNGYWRDVGTLDSYFQTNFEFLESPPFDTQDVSWPILTRFAPLGAARIAPGASVENALVSPGCEIHGEVRNVILGPGVTIEKSAHVENAILLSGARVVAGKKLAHAIVDEGVRVDKNMGGPELKIVV